MKHAWMLILCPLLGGCSIGPQVETRHIFVYNGKPCTIMENKIVKVATIDGGRDDLARKIQRRL